MEITKMIDVERMIFVKSKIFRSNDAEYQKFYAEMVAMFTAPGLIELDYEDISPFKNFTGSVYMGEAKFTGHKAAEIAAKDAISESENFASAKIVLLHILGSENNVEGATASEAVSVIRETAPDAECIFAAHFDDTLDDTIRVTVVAKIP